jgi:hypothetical protein
MRRRGFYCIAVVLTVLLNVVCSHDAIDPIAGPSTQEGNPQIVAVVIDSLKQPVAGVTVSTYRVADNTDTSQPPVAAALVAQGITDSSGRCAFDSLTAGIYSIEANDWTTSQRALKAGITITGDSAKERTDTLQLDRPGTIRGVVSRGGVLGGLTNQNANIKDGAIMVIVQEIEVPSKITPQNGTYSFTSLPPGQYTIFYYATNGFYSAKQSVTVAAGDTVFADTVILKPLPSLTPLPPKGFTADYDTAAALIRCSWQKVVFNDLRWYEVQRYDFNGPYDALSAVTDTFFVDSVATIPSGTKLTYVVRAVSSALNPSENAGPIEITIR